jgi:N12 class adenine-specific DNA methylase
MMTTDPNAWIFEDIAQATDNADPNAWIFEDEPAPAPEQPKEEPTIWGKAGQVLRSGMSNVSAFSPVMGLATEIVSPQNPDDTVGAAALRGLGQGGLAIGQAASGLVTSLPGTMLKSHPVDKIREMTAPYASDQVDKTWQGMPRPQGQDALSEAVTKFAGEVGEGTADLLRGPVADKLLEIGKENAQEYERWGKEIHATVPEYRRGKDFIHDPALLLNPEYMIEGGISAAVSMVPPILAAMGTGGSALVAGTVGGMMEGLPFLQELLDKGTMPEEALVRSGAYAASSAALNAFSFGKMLDVGVMDALKVRGAKIIAAAGWEGFTEWLEGPVQALAEHVGDLPMVKKDSTLGADAMQGLGKAFSEQDPASLVEALTKSGREEAAVIPGAIMAGGGMSSVNQFSAPEHGESETPANRDTFAVDEERPLDILNFSIDEQRAGDDPVLDGKRVGLMNALTGLQSQGLAQEAMPTTPDQQVIEEQVGLSRPPARPEGYYEQPVLAPEQVQEFEQGLSTQPGPVETYPVEDYEAEWQARKADQDAMNEQARLEAEWKARGGPEVQAPAIQSDIDQKAHEAASSPLNDRSAPTKEQEKAGNYKKGHAFVNGLDISIENPAGSTRSGTDQDGNEWSTEMRNHYGYIKGTQGADKDHVDVFLGPDPKGAPSVFVVDQVNPETGEFDEHKAMIGFENADQARKAYLSNYEEGWQGIGAITEMPFAEFKEWARSKKTKKPVGDISKADRPGAETVTAPAQAEASPKTAEEIKAKARAEMDAAESARFDAMVKDAARWRGAARKLAMEIGSDTKEQRSAALYLSKMTTKGDLDAYLMRKYGLAADEARNISNHLTARAIPDDMTATVEDFKDEPWAKEFSKPKEKPAPVEAEANPYTLTDISEKAFVVTGDTRPIKDKLKSLGGLWNRKHGGWVFSKKKREKVQEALGMTGKASQDSNDVRKAEELAAQYERDGRTRSEFIEEAPLKLGWIYRNSAGALQESSGNDAVRNAFKDAGYSRPGSIAEVWDKAVGGKGDKDTVGNVLAVLGGLEGTSVEITKSRDGYSVIVRDDDTGKTAGVVYQYKDYDQAKRAANAISKGMDPKSENVPGTLGRNRAGHVVGEDANGVRYFIRGNVRVDQPVGIIPGKGYQIDTPERLFALGGNKLDFLTTEEIARFDQPEEGGQPGQAPDTSDLSRDDYADLFDEELAAATAPKPKKPLVKRTAEERAQDAAPKEPKEKKPLVKKPKDQMSDAAKKMADGAAAALNVFSKYGGLSIRVLKEGDEINQDLYRELKPHLMQVMEGAREMGHAGKELAREVVRFLIKAFGEKAAQAKPYFMRFVDEEILAADTKEQEDGTSPQGPGNVEVLEGQADLDDGQRTGPDGTDVQDAEDANDISGRSGSTGGSLGDAPAQGGDAGGRGEGNSNVDGGADSGGRTRKPTSGRKAKDDSDLGGQAPRQNARNHRVEPDDVLVPGGAVARAKANIAAIRLVKKLQEENRDATPEEKRVLQQFTGWGSLAQEVFKPEHDRAAAYEARSGQPFYSSYHAGAYAEAFSKWKEKYGKHLHPALGGLMTQEEWDAAKDSTLNAHYTDRPVIEAMWKMVERMGFTGGRVLEPSAGTGLFFGLMPESLAAKSKLTGVELDSLTGAILEKLYPDADIQVTGFETAKRVGDNTLDLVISNFPFGSFKVFDKARPQYSKQSIHNYFFSRSIDAVRPGGMVVAITSHFTLDAGSSGKLREEWAKKADFVGAVRLPGTAFEKNAGTQVTTDILIFRKKTVDSFTSEPFRHLAEIETPQGKTQINEYFVNNPDMVLGKHSLQGTMYGGENEYTVIPGSEPIAEGLAKATKRLPADVFGRGQAKGEQADTANKEAAEKAQREGTMVEKDGKVFLVENGFLTAPKWSEPKKKQAKDYVGVKRVTLELIDAMSKIDDDAEVAKVRDKLNKVYDAYVKKHGTINKKGNKFLEDDLEFPTVAALEIVTMVPVEKVRTSGANKGQTYTTMEPSVQKADIFTKRTVFPFREPTTAESLEDAIKISRVYRNGIDVDYVAELLKTTPGVAKDQLIESRAAFENPETGLLEPRDLYLSGNVKAKLNIAKAALSGNPAYKVNVEALEEVQPADLPIDAIRVRLGSYWLPTEIVERFLKHLGVRHASVSRTRVEGTEGSTQWDVGGLLSAETQKWGTEGADVRHLVLDSLNLKRTVVYDEVPTEGNKTKKVKNPQESLAAQEKQRVIQDEFRKWVLQDEAASRQIESLYNEKFNGHVARKFEVPDIIYYPGASHTIALRENQKVGVARALQESTLLAHGVGSGKTFLQITLAMEMRRLGTAKKPWIVVQGSTLSQFAASFKALYPGARILAPTEGQRTAKNRQRLLAQIASGDWDAIITPHGFFNSISIDPENETRFIMEQIAEFEDMIMADFDTSGMSERQLEMNPTVKAIRRKIKAMKARLEKLANNRKDANIYFENLGVDALIIDEAHAYKRGEFYTKMDNVKGLDRDSSQRSMQMLMKSRHVQEKTGGKNVIMATGTPISNTLTEMWTMFRYIRPDLLEAFGVEQFDDFASTFADTSISQEETSTGDYKDVERFNVYVNGPELLTMWRTAADVVITEELDYIKGLPKIMGGKVQEVAVERSEELGNYIRALKAERDDWDRLPGKEKREQSHVPLVIFGRAKKAAIDLRLIDPGMPDTPGSKANTAVENIFQRWQDNHDTKATQIVFCDIFQSSDKTFNLFHDIRDKLLAKGIPANQIAIIHDFKKDEDRAKLFDKVKAGEVRVIMGTTEKLGVGVNVQDRLLTAHHLDAPPRPMDFEQRNGRIRRPGNMHPEVEILVYGTKNTLDSVTFQQLISKQKFINQVLRGEMQGRSFENPFDEVQATFADMMAAFSGNPLAKEKMQLQSELRKLTMLKSAHDDRIYGMRNDIRGRERGIEHRKEKLVIAEKAAAFVAEHFADGIPNRKELNQRVQDWIDKARKQIVAKVETAKTYEQWRALVSDKMTMTTEFDIGHGVKVKVAAVPVYAMNSDQVIVDRDIRTEFSCFGPHEIHSFTTSFTGGAGLMTRITNFMGSVQGEPDNLKAQIKEHEENIAALKVEQGKPFERQAELDAAQKRYDEVEAELAHALNEDLEAGKAELSEEGDEIDIQYQVATATTPQTVDIRAAFPWADSITEDGDGRTVVTKGKNSFAVTRVEQITPDEVAFKIQYKRAFDPKTDKIAGDYREGEIRVSKAGDKWTLMHEYYHALEDMGLVNKMEQAILSAAAKKAGYAMAPSENRAYYVQDQLAARDFNRKTPVGRILQKIADMVDSFVNLFTRTARGIVRDVESGKMMERETGGADNAADSKYALSGLPSRVKAELQPKIDYLRMKFQDKFLPLKRVQEKLIRDGWTMTDEADAYRAEELFSGKAGQRLEKFQKDKVGRLLENMKDLGVSLAELEDYLYAKYAPQRNAYIATINPDMPDGGSGHTNQWAADKLAEFARAGRTRKLEALAKVVRSIAQMQRDIIRNEGLEKDETVDDWEMGNPDYVPLKGGKEETPRTIGTGFNIKRSGTKRALGRKSPATDILAHLFAQVGDTIIRAEKAKVGRAFLKMAEQNPDAELWRVHKHLPTKRGMVSKTNMARLRQKESSLKKLLALKSIKSNTRAAATRHLADVQAAIAAGGTKQVGNVVDMSFPMKDNVLTVTLEDGSVRYVELFDDDLARVMKNLTPGQHGRVVQGIAAFTRFLSMVNTSLNPEFVITNFERDLLTALVHLSGEQRTAIARKVVKDIPSAMRGIYNHLRGDGAKDWAVWYDMFKDAGAHVSFMDLRGLDQIKKDIENMTTDSSSGAYAKGKAATMKLLDFIGDVNTTVENAVRLSAFKNLIESGTSESDAASIAKNLTVNFNRKGELGPAMNAAYMFFNAGVQGSARILFALKNRRVQKMMAAVTLLAFGLAELNVLMGGDDDDDEAKWDKHANEWVKQTNLIIMLPTGDSVKIRMPYGYNFFVALGYALSDVRRWGMGDGGKNPAEAATFLFKAAMNAFNPMGDDSLLQMISPTVMDPFVQIATNENFMGTPIAPEQNPWGPPKPNSQLYFRSVSKPSKVAAEFINSVTGGDKWDPGAVDFSPEWIDHIYDYLTGGLGRTVRDTLSLPATLVDQDIAVRRIPFLRQVYQERDSRVDMNRFYDNVLKIDKSQAMIKEAPLADRKGFVQDHPELRLRKRAEGLKRRLSTLRKEMYRHQDAGDKVKAAEVEESMRKLVVNFNKKFNEVMSGMGR